MPTTDAPLTIFLHVKFSFVTLAKLKAFAFATSEERTIAQTRPSFFKLLISPLNQSLPSMQIAETGSPANILLAKEAKNFSFLD